MSLFAPSSRTWVPAILIRKTGSTTWVTTDIDNETYNLKANKNSYPTYPHDDYFERFENCNKFLIFQTRFFNPQ